MFNKGNTSAIQTKKTVPAIADTVSNIVPKITPKCKACGTRSEA